MINAIQHSICPITCSDWEMENIKQTSDEAGCSKQKSRSHDQRILPFLLYMKKNNNTLGNIT